MTELSLEDCTTFLFSNAEKQDARRTRAYFRRFIAYPDPGSEFDKSFGGKKWAFRIPLLSSLAMYAASVTLPKRGYNLLVLQHKDEIIGHTAFQAHNDGWHVFGVRVNGYEGRGLARYMQERLIEEARTAGVSRLRLGAGNHDSMNRILANFKDREFELGVKVEQENWMTVYNFD